MANTPNGYVAYYQGKERIILKDSKPLNTWYRRKPSAKSVLRSMIKETENKITLANSLQASEKGKL